MEMIEYAGQKRILARPMNRQEYNDYRGWDLPDDENGADEGYLVEYLDSPNSNHPNHAGYISWSPAAVFDDAYRPDGALTFGDALAAMKRGAAVARKGWNGKGMFLYLFKGSFDGEYRGFGLGEQPAPGHRSTQDGVSFSLFECGPAGMPTYLPCIAMRTATGAFLRGWLASQTDMLAEDWHVVEPGA